MRKKPSQAFALLVLSLLVFFGVPNRQFDVKAQDKETLGQQAEQAGKLREAVTHYIAALQVAPEGSEADQRLREKIIALVQKINPPPAVPDSAVQFMGRGKAAVEIAKDPEDFKKAAEEFQKALRLAPWLANGYFNLGIVQDKAGQYAEAIRSFKLYLLAAPSTPDADEVRTKIAGLEYKIERQRAKERAAREKQEAEESAERDLRQKLSFLLGRWTLERTNFGSDGDRSLSVYGTFEFVMTDQSLEGFEIVTREVLYLDRPKTSYVENPERHVVLRGVLAGSNPENIHWTGHFEMGPPCPNQGRWGSWIPLSVIVSSDRRRLSFVLPKYYHYGRECAEYERGEVFTLTK